MATPAATEHKTKRLSEHALEELAHIHMQPREDEMSLPVSAG